MTNIWLFFKFVQFSVMLFGGGYMIIPFLMTTFVEERHVLTLNEFGNLVAIAQMTPGAVSMNAATYIGFIENGVWGALSASFGLIFPTLFLSLLAVSLLNKWKEKPWLNGLLKGARLAALGMIMYACLIFMDMSVFSTPIPWQTIKLFITTAVWQPSETFFILIPELIITIIACILTLKTKIPIIPMIIIAGIIGVFIYL